MKTRLATINLQVADPRRSRQFYEDVLGMVDDPRRSHPPNFLYLRSDGIDLTLAALDEADSVLPTQTIELGFEVDDFQAMKDHLSVLGVPDHKEESMGWGRALELHDPDRHRIVIYSLNETKEGAEA